MHEDSEENDDENYLAILETLYLLSIPGMRESIQDGIKMPVAECATELDWGAVSE